MSFIENIRACFETLPRPRTVLGISTSYKPAYQDLLNVLRACENDTGSDLKNREKALYNATQQFLGRVTNLSSRDAAAFATQLSTYMDETTTAAEKSKEYGALKVKYDSLKIRAAATIHTFKERASNRKDRIKELEAENDKLKEELAERDARILYMAQAGGQLQGMLGMTLLTLNKAKSLSAGATLPALDSMVSLAIENVTTAQGNISKTTKTSSPSTPKPSQAKAVAASGGGGGRDDESDRDEEFNFDDTPEDLSQDGGGGGGGDSESDLSDTSGAKPAPSSAHKTGPFQNYAASSNTKRASGSAAEMGR